MTTDFGVILLLLINIIATVLVSRAVIDSSTRYRVALIEKKIDLILAKLDIPFQDSLPNQITELMARGQKIEAIKMYREATGAGLKEAVEAVEKLALGAGEGSPAAASAPKT